MSSSLTNIIVHLVFSTKNREPLLTSETRTALHPYIGGIIKNKGGVMLEIGGVEDHIHILLRQRQDVSVADMVRIIKSNSSKWLNETTQNPDNRFAWQTGYGAFTVSASQIEPVRKYIQNQETHHKSTGFQDEYLGFLHKNSIAHDPRYVFG